MILLLGFKMTAAATTGPARGPRPASSTPAIINLMVYPLTDNGYIMAMYLFSIYLHILTHNITYNGTLFS